jgi:hypothetical protein
MSSYWNYRLIRFGNSVEPYIALMEVYYTNGKPTSYCQARITGDDLMGIQDQIDRAMAACAKPILDVSEFGSEVDEND